MPRILLCLILILVMFQNCSQVDLVALQKDITSTLDEVPTPTPTPIPTATPNPQARVKKALLCRSESIGGKLRYYTDVLDFATGTIGDRKETGNCASLVIADLDGDQNDEWINVNSNSTLNPCKLEVYVVVIMSY